MNQPLICMTLTGKTLEEDIRLVKKYEKLIDLVELRVDYLNEEEQLYVRRFPSCINVPCVLTIRRDIDGGLFTAGEFSRTNLFARALAFANQNRSKNFAYVDFEDDYHIPSIQDGAHAFGVKIIRSFHDINNPVYNLKEKCDEMRKAGYEIPKIAFTPKKLADLSNMFVEGAQMTDYEHIFCAMGNIGVPSRILSAFTNSYLTYTTPEETSGNIENASLIDVNTLLNVYNFRNITKETQLFGITGNPIKNSASPRIHNAGYKKFNIDGVYVPVTSTLVSESLNFAEKIGMKGLSVTVPHKESVMYYLENQSPEVIQVGACNTVVRTGKGWTGYNTDVTGFMRALKEFLGPIKIKYKKVAVIGAGGAAKAVVYTLKQMGARVCIFNRTISHARQLAEKYGYKYCALEPDCAPVLDEYSTLIIQTTSVGMQTDNPEVENQDPIYFYNFRGNELFFDLIYKPAITPAMKRASLAGCRVCNGYKMLEYQAYEQFKLFTGKNYEE